MDEGLWVLRGAEREGIMDERGQVRGKKKRNEEGAMGELLYHVDRMWYG